MSKRIWVPGFGELQVKKGRQFLDRLLIEPEFQEASETGDVRAWFEALGIEHVHESERHFGESLDLIERRELIRKLMSGILQAIKDEIEIKTNRRRGWP